MSAPRLDRRTRRRRPDRSAARRCPAARRRNARHADRCRSRSPARRRSRAGRVRARQGWRRDCAVAAGALRRHGCELWTVIGMVHDEAAPCRWVRIDECGRRMAVGQTAPSLSARLPAMSTRHPRIPPARPLPHGANRADEKPARTRPASKPVSFELRWTPREHGASPVQTVPPARAFHHAATPGNDEARTSNEMQEPDNASNEGPRRRHDRVRERSLRSRPARRRRHARRAAAQGPAAEPAQRPRRHARDARELPRPRRRRAGASRTQGRSRTCATTAARRRSPARRSRASSP